MSKLKEMFPNHVLRDKYDYEFPQFTADDMVEFAEEVAKESLKNASENAKCSFNREKIIDSDGELQVIVQSIDKQSILDENNIPRL